MIGRTLTLDKLEVLQRAARANCHQVEIILKRSKGEQLVQMLREQQKAWQLYDALDQASKDVRTMRTTNGEFG